MYRKLVSIIVLLSFVSYLASCTTMRYVPREEISKVEQESTVWVIMIDGTQYEIKDPKIDGSKLTGYVEQEGYREIEFSEIESLGIKELDEKKTIKMAAIGVTGAIILIWLLSDGESDGPPCST